VPGSSAFPPSVRALIQRRAGGCCELCGARVEHLELHHRQYRSRGGPGTVENGLALCGWGNHTGCHGWAHTSPLAASWGASLPSGSDPAAEPVWSEPRGCWVQLLPDGRAEPT
jgi:hypothetical protein